MAVRLVLSLVTSSLDCNSSLAGLRQSSLDPVHRVQNVAARLDRGTTWRHAWSNFIGCQFVLGRTSGWAGSCTTFTPVAHLLTWLAACQRRQAFRNAKACDLLERRPTSFPDYTHEVWREFFLIHRSNCCLERASCRPKLSTCSFASWKTIEDIIFSNLLSILSRNYFMISVMRVCSCMYCTQCQKFIYVYIQRYCCHSEHGNIMREFFLVSLKVTDWNLSTCRNSHDFRTAMFESRGSSSSTNFPLYRQGILKALKSIWIFGRERKYLLHSKEWRQRSYNIF